MAVPLSRIKFYLRSGGVVTDVAGGNAWTDFEGIGSGGFGYIEDWSGILSEGPISGDIIEQDWVDGAIWQRGVNKTYSFDVPFTGFPIDTINPNIWDSYRIGIFRLRGWRGLQLTLRREFFDKTGTLVRREQALGVLVTDLAVKVVLGRVVSSVVVFQNLSGDWTQVTTA